MKRVWKTLDSRCPCAHRLAESTVASVLAKAIFICNAVLFKTFMALFTRREKFLNLSTIQKTPNNPNNHEQRRGMLQVLQ